jgi:translation elongation factor EF-1beta
MVAYGLRTIQQHIVFPDQKQDPDIDQIKSNHMPRSRDVNIASTNKVVKRFLRFHSKYF